MTRLGWGLDLKKFVALVIMWIMVLLFWLYSAYGLEFLGMNNFLLVWMGSLVFHVFNVLCIATLISNAKGGGGNPRSIKASQHYN